MKSPRNTNNTKFALSSYLRGDLPRRSRATGFTLIELLVVLSIFVIVTAIVLFQYGNLRSTSSLSNLSADISLSIRRAQSYAIGASNSGSNFSYGYGAHFSTVAAGTPGLNSDAGSNKAFVLFTDVSGDGMYDVNPSSVSCNQQNLSPTSECTEVLTISGADQISGIYLNGSTTPIPVGDTVDITFLRPNPDAHFCYVPAGSPSCDPSSNTISNVTIRIQSLDQTQGLVTQDITVWNTGQISTSE